MDVRVPGPEVERSDEVLTPEALDFVGDLQTRFASTATRCWRPGAPGAWLGGNGAVGCTT